MLTVIAWESFLIGKSSFQTGKNVVSIEAEAQDLLRELAAPAVPGERVAAAINRAYAKLRVDDFSFSRVTKLWYGNARAILAVEMDRLRAKAAEVRDVKQDGIRERQIAVLRQLDEIQGAVAVLRARLEVETAAYSGGAPDSLSRLSGQVI